MDAGVQGRKGRKARAPNMYEIEALLIRFLLIFFEADALNAFFRNPQTTAIFIGILISIAGGVLGCFLLLRGMSLTSDAISHTVLLGIVLVFLLMNAFGAVPDLTSPWLLIGAAAAGVLTVFLTEALQHTHLLKKDAALGLIFPLLFAIAIIFVSRYSDDVHLDNDSVMIGEIGVAWANTNSHSIGSAEGLTITADDPRAEFIRRCVNCLEDDISPRDPSAVFDLVCGNCGDYTPAQAYSEGFISEAPRIVFWPRALTVMLLFCLLTLAFVLLFFKELKISTFDPSLAHSLGFNPTLLLYLLMTLVSLVVVGAFDAVGSILVIAFFIIPPSAAYLLSDHLGIMLMLSAGIGSLSTFFGYQLSRGRVFGINIAALTGGSWDSSIAASMGVTMLFFFCIILLVSPRQGIFAVFFRRLRQKRSFKEQALLGHIHHHSGTAREATELSRQTLSSHLQWEEKYLTAVLSRLTKSAQIYTSKTGLVLLTEKGKQQVERFHREMIAALPAQAKIK